MIPTLEQLEDIPRLREGSLTEVTVPALLCAYAVHRQTVVVEIHRRQVWKKVLFENGVPIDCRSNLSHETLGRFMVLEGKLSEEDFTQNLSRSAARGVPLGELLLEHGLITAVELFRLLQQNLAKKLLDLFTWREGEFRVLDEVAHPDSSLKIKVPQLILTGVTKLAPQEEVDMAVGPLVGKKLCLHPSPAFPLEEIRLSASQNRLVEAIRPGRRMGELAEATGLPFDEITRLLYALAILGVVVPAEALPKGVAPVTGAFPRLVLVPPLSTPPPPAPVAAAPAAAPDPAPAAAPAAAVSPQALEQRRNEIMQAYLSYRRQDAFDLLGIPEDAPAALREAKFLEFSRRFAPWSLDHPELAALEERARDLFLAGAMAYAELMNVEQRNTLVFRRKTLRDERARKPAANFAIKTDLLDSEAQYKKGRALLDAGRPKEALQLLEFAADCDPQNSLYGAETAHCRFLVTEALAGTALKELQEILRRDPGCGIAAFYAGEINRHLGNWDQAEDLLRRAIKAMSPDRRPIDALKALSTERKR